MWLRVVAREPEEGQGAHLLEGVDGPRVEVGDRGYLLRVEAHPVAAAEHAAEVRQILVYYIFADDADAVRARRFPLVCEDAAGTSVDVDGGLRLTTSVLARAVAGEMPAEGTGGDFEQYDGDFDDGNDADDEPVLDEDEDGEPWAVDEMSERRRAVLDRYRAALLRVTRTRHVPTVQ
eukprot:3562959-Prymnesium_polylepis.1